MKTRKMVIYIGNADAVDPIYFGSLSNEDKILTAQQNEEASIMSLESFEQSFNDDYISDLGYIFFIDYPL